MRVTMEKLPGVESATVSLNEGRAVIQLKAGNTTTMAQILESVKRNGFTPQQAVVTAQADVVPKGTRLQVKISGTNDTYDLATTALQQPLQKNAGQRILIEGIVPAQKNPKATPVIQVNSVKPVTPQ